MQQKKIIFAILSVVCGSTYTMEKDSQTKPEQSIKINPATGLPEGCVKCGPVYLPGKYLNDIVLENIIPNWQKGQVSVKPSGQLKEYENRSSSLPGAEKTRENAVWLDSFSKLPWNEHSKGKKERYFFVVDSEKTNQMLNEYVALILQTLEKQ